MIHCLRPWSSKPHKGQGSTHTLRYVGPGSDRLTGRDNLNTERLHAIALSVQDDWEETNAPSLLQQIVAALQNMVASPGSPQYEETLSNSIAQLREAAELSDAAHFPATWVEALSELGLAQALTPAISATVGDSIGRNQMTPSVARDELTSYAAEVEVARTAVAQLLESFLHLDIGSEDLSPGTAEMAVLIPRAAVDNDLPDLGREFVQLQKIVGPFLEAATGSREPLKVNAISSSDFGVFLDVAPEAGAFIAVAVERVIALYKNLLEIRRIRQELALYGVPDESAAGVEAHANTVMSDGIRDFAETVELPGAGADEGRANELRLEIRLSMNAIANRIDLGYNIDVRASQTDVDEADAQSESENSHAESLAKIIDLTPRLKFINPIGKPLLHLEESPSSNEILPDDK